MAGHSSPAADVTVPARPTQDISGWAAAGVDVLGIKRPERIDVLPLPRDIIGRIIGRAGATIKEIREKSGARVDARDQTEDPVQVLISGTNEAVEMAKGMLQEAAEGAAQAAGHSSLGAASSAYRAPSVEDAVAKAKAQAAAAAAAVSAAAAASEAGEGGAAAESAAAASGPPMLEEHLELPRHATGKVIGTKGTQIAEIRQRSGCQVDVDKSQTGCRVRIIGIREQVDHAKSLIMQLMAPPGSDGGGEYLEIPKTAVGRIIGAGGSRIQELQERSGAKIDIDRTGERCMVRFSGFPENVAAAKTMVAEVLEGRDRSVMGESHATMEVPSSCTGRLIGPGGKQINEIQEKSGAKVDIDKSREPCIVRLVGTKDAVAMAEAMVREVIVTMPPAALMAGRPPSLQPPPPLGAPPSQAGRLNLVPPGGGPAMDEETIRFDVPLNILERLLGSDHGAWVRNVSARTGARIQVKRDPAGKCFLELSGQPEQVVEAESLCEDAVRHMSVAAIADSAAAVASGGPNSAGGSLPPGAAPGATTLQRPPAPPPGAPVPGASSLPRGPPQQVGVPAAPWSTGPGRPDLSVPSPRPEQPSPQQPPPEALGAAPGAVGLGLRPSMVQNPATAPAATAMAPATAPAPAFTVPGPGGWPQPPPPGAPPPGVGPPPPVLVGHPPGATPLPPWAQPQPLPPAPTTMQPPPPWAMQPMQPVQMQPAQLVMQPPPPPWALPPTG